MLEEVDELENLLLGILKSSNVLEPCPDLLIGAVNGGSGLAHSHDVSETSHSSTHATFAALAWLGWSTLALAMVLLVQTEQHHYKERADQDVDD